MLKKILYYVPSMVVPIIINLIIIILCGRWLSPAEYGVMSIYTTTITLIYSFGLSFIQSAGLRFFTDERCRDKAVYYTTFLLSNVFLSVILTGIVFVVRIFVPQINVFIVSFSVLANGLFMFSVNIDRLEDKHLKYTVARCIASVMNLAIFVILVLELKQATSFSPIISLYGAYLIIAIFKIVTKLHWFSLKKFSSVLFIESMKFGLPLIGVSAVGSIIANSDQYMLLYYLDEASVGLYSLGYKIADYSVTRFTTLLLTVATPTIIRCYDEKKFDKSAKTIVETVDSISWIWFALMSLCLMYSKELILFVFPAYEGAEVIMQVVIIAALFHCISQLYCKPFELAKKTNELMVYSIIAGAINVIYNLVFIPKHGTIAAAVSSVLAYLFLDVMLLFRGKKYMDVTPSLVLTIKMVCTAAVTCGAAYGMKLMMRCDKISTFIIQLVACGLIYIGMSLVTGQLKEIFQISSKKNAEKTQCQ